MYLLVVFFQHFVLERILGIHCAAFVIAAIDVHRLRRHKLHRVPVMHITFFCREFFL